MMIEHEQLVEVFESTRANPSVHWTVDGTCLWGYFFTDHDREKLLKAPTTLEGLGYQPVGFLEPTEQDMDRGLLFLQVERKEVHTVDILHSRNSQLYRFAEEYGLESYDGMDVGPA